MSKKYLDDSGLSTLASLINTKIANAPCNLKFEMRSINKFGLATSGDASVLANRDYTQNVCTVTAPAGTKIYVFAYTRATNYANHSSATGNYTNSLLINNTEKASITNKKVRYVAIGEFLGCDHTATGNADQISVKLHSSSSSSEASFCSTFVVVIGENITVSAATPDSTILG